MQKQQQKVKTQLFNSLTLLIYYLLKSEVFYVFYFIFTFVTVMPIPIHAMTS